MVRIDLAISAATYVFHEAFYKHCFNVIVLLLMYFRYLNLMKISNL